jgi:hypothetical protein
LSDLTDRALQGPMADFDVRVVTKAG